MSNRTNIAAASKNILFVPLNRLKKSPKNVRKVPHMRRVFAKPVPLSKTERKRLHKLQARLDALYDQYSNGDGPDNVAKMERIQTAIREALPDARLAAKIAQAPGLDGNDAQNAVLGKTSEPTLKARYEQQELKRKGD